MPQCLRRNSKFKPTDSSAPYNELYEAFRSTLSNVFIERMPEGQRANTYVSVPDVESEIDRYINSDSSQIAVLHGLMGCGKSTIIEAQDDKFKRNATVKFIYLNMAGRHFHLQLPPNFTALSKADRRIAARSIVVKRFNELLLPIVDQNFHHINLEFFQYMRTNHITEIGRKALFARSEEQKMQILFDFMADEDQTAPIQCFLRYIAAENKISRVVVAIDNVDEQPFEIVEAIYFALTDFIECLMRNRNPKINGLAEADGAAQPVRPSFRAIIACRSHTFNALKEDEGGIHQTRGASEVAVLPANLLNEILKRRIDYFRQQTASGNIKQDRPYATKRGMTISVTNVFSFLDSILDQIGKRSIDTPLFSLFNLNYARAIKGTKYIIQNRYFKLFDSEVMGGGSIEVDLHYSNVISALGYGNPRRAEDLYYPAKSTVISNVLWWDYSQESSLFLIVKILTWLETNGYSSRGGVRVRSDGCTMETVSSVFYQEFGVPASITKWAVTYCHSNGLVFAATGYEAPLFDDESICISPKGETLIGELFRSMIFFEMFVDDLCPPDGNANILNERPPVTMVSVYPRRVHFLDSLKWIEGFHAMESRLILEMWNKSHSQAKNHIDLMGGRLVSEKLGIAMSSVYEVYYKKFCREEDEEKLRQFLRSSQSFVSSLQRHKMK